MLPILQKQVIEKRGWITEEQAMDFYAVGQSMPGLIAVNVSIFTGYHLAGVPGAVVAAVGTAMPSLIIILIIAAFLENFTDLAVVQHAFAGIRVAVSAMVVGVVFRMWKTGVKDLLGVALVLVTFLLSTFTDISPIPVVVGAILVGVIVKGLRYRPAPPADGEQS